MEDDLVREIHGILAAYVEKADYAFKQHDTVCNVLLSADGDTVFRTTFPRPHFYQPPVDLERDYGLTGIAGHYRLPKGLSAPELQGYGEILRHAAQAGEISVDDMNGRLDEVILSLSARNPSLAGVDPGKNWLGRYNIVLGIASDFNAKDIQFFIDTFPALTPDDGGRYNALWAKIKNVPLIWQPAPETLIKIASQLDGRAVEPKPLPKWDAL